MVASLWVSKCLLLVPLTLPPSLEFLNASSDDFSAWNYFLVASKIIQPLFEYFQEPELNIYLFTPVFLFCFAFWMHSILVPQPGIKPGLAVKVPSSNPWTTREFPFHSFF